MTSEIRVNKIENRSGLGTVTFADTGVDLAGIVTATTFSGSGASLTDLPAGNLSGTVADARLTTVSSSKLSGALPALDGSALTGVASTDNIRTNTDATFLKGVNVSGIATVGSAVTISESGIEASGIGITCANINGTQIGGRRNIVINGAMNVAQRATSSTTTSGYNVVDRFFTTASNFDQLAATISQDSESPDGFAKSLKWATTTPETTVDSDESLYIGYKFEGQDLQQLNYGGSSATDFTISFYVKTSITGTYSLTIYRDEPGADRICTRTYTVPDTNWHRYTFTVAGDTSRVIQNDTSSRMRLMFHIASGSDYTSSTSSTWVDYGNAYFAGGHAANGVATTDNATFYLTGVQLEVGSQATVFEHRSFGEERLLCQRYYQDIASSSDLVMFGSGRASGTTNALVSTPLSVPLRASPTISQTNYSTWGTEGSHTVSNTTPTVQYFHANNTFLPMNFHSTASLTNARVATVSSNSGSSLIMDAEL